MKALFLASSGIRDPASRTRVFQYLPLLRDRGLEPDVKVVVADSVYAKGVDRGRFWKLWYYVTVIWLYLKAGTRTVVRASCYDVIFIQRVLFPFPLPTLLRRHRHKVIYDFDDAIFTTERVEATGLERLRSWFHGRSLGPVLAAAAHAVVENEYTAGYAERCGTSTTVITGPIDTRRYNPGLREDGASVVIGWIGSPSTAEYIELIRGPLETLADQHPGLVLRIVGASGLQFGRLTVDEREWSLETEVADLRTFDIGLMPLPDNPWTQGKGGYKILQYSAMGLPVVASPVGVNSRLVDHGVSGFLASSGAEWVSHLNGLINDAALRRKMGRAGRSKMERCYALDRAADRLFSLFSSVGGASRAPTRFEKRA